jgi:hypothetical protein
VKEILEENNRLKAEVEKLISDNMELTAVIRSLRKVAREDADAMTAQQLWAETIRETCLNLEKERDEAITTLRDTIQRSNEVIRELWEKNNERHA